MSVEHKNEFDVEEFKAQFLATIDNTGKDRSVVNRAEDLLFFLNQQLIRFPRERTFILEYLSEQLQATADRKLAEYAYSNNFLGELNRDQESEEERPNFLVIGVIIGGGYGTCGYASNEI